MEISSQKVWEVFVSRNGPTPQCLGERFFSVVLAIFLSLGFSVNKDSVRFLKLKGPPKTDFVETLDVLYDVVEKEDNDLHLVIFFGSDYPDFTFLRWHIDLIFHIQRVPEVIGLNYIQHVIDNYSDVFENFLKPAQEFARCSPERPEAVGRASLEGSSSGDFNQLEALDVVSKMSIPDLSTARAVCKEWRDIASRCLSRTGPWILMCVRDKSTRQYHEEIWCPRMGLKYPVKAPNPKYLYRAVASSGGLVCSQMLFRAQGLQASLATRVLSLAVGDPLENTWRDLPMLGLVYPGLGVYPGMMGRELTFGFAWDVQMEASEDGSFKIRAVPTICSSRSFCGMESTSVPIIYDSKVGSWKKLVMVYQLSEDEFDTAKWGDLEVGTWKDIQAPVFLTEWDDYWDCKKAVVYVSDRNVLWKLVLPPVRDDLFTLSEVEVETCDAYFITCYCRHPALLHWKAQGLRDKCSGRIFIVSAIRYKVYIRGFVIYEVGEDKSLTLLSHVLSESVFGEPYIPLPVHENRLFADDHIRYTLEGGFIIITLKYDSKLHGVWRPPAYDLKSKKWSTIKDSKEIDYEGVCIFTPNFGRQKYRLPDETAPNIKNNLATTDHIGNFLDNYDM